MNYFRTVALLIVCTFSLLPTARADNPPTWTVLVYGSADNNLAGAFKDDLEEMMSVGSGSGLEVIVQWDSNTTLDDTSHETIGDSKVQPVGVHRLRVVKDDLQVLQSFCERDLGLQSELEDFLTWGLTTYPADNVMVVLWGHGLGWRGYGPDNQETTHTVSRLSVADVDLALANSLAAAGRDTVSLLQFDACLMGMHEVIEVLHSRADHLNISEELVPGHGFNYEALKGARHDSPGGGATLQELAETFVDETVDWSIGHKKSDSLTVASVSTFIVPSLNNWVEAYAEEAADAMGPFTAAAIAKVRGKLHGQGSGGEEGMGSCWNGTKAVDCEHVDSGIALWDLTEPGGTPGRSSAEGLLNHADLWIDSWRGSLKKHAKRSHLALYFPEVSADFDPAYAAQNVLPEWVEFLQTYYDWQDSDEPTWLFDAAAWPAVGGTPEGIVSVDWPMASADEAVGGELWYGAPDAEWANGKNRPDLADGMQASTQLRRLYIDGWYGWTQLHADLVRDDDDGIVIESPVRGLTLDWEWVDATVVTSLSLRTGETRVELAGSDRRGGRALADFYYVVPLRASLDSAAEPEWEEDWNSILFAADEFEVVVESWEPGEPVSLTAVAWDLGRFRSTGTWSGTPEAADAEEEESEEPYEPAR